MVAVMVVTVVDMVEVVMEALLVQDLVLRVTEEMEMVMVTKYF
jgi:hypothetical protein